MAVTRYSGGQANYVASLMYSYTEGLVSAAVAKTWLSAENGENNNPYGVTVGGKLASYPSLAAGVKAAADLLLHGSPYAATRARLKAAGNKVGAQLSAIASSPWNGTPGYYARVFSQNGDVRVMDSRLPHPGAGTPSSPPTTDKPELGGWGDAVTFPVGHTLTSSDIDKIMAALDAQGQFGVEGPFGPIGLAENAARVETKKLLEGVVGQAWTKGLQDQLQQQFGQAATQAVPDPQAMLLRAATPLLVNGAMLAVVLGLGYVGLRKILG